MKHEETIEKIVASFGGSLYGIETEKQGDDTIYRILVQSPEGVTLDLCESISRTLSPILDLNPPVSGGYYLEVSSPGVERKLKTLAHFRVSVGESAKVVTKGGDKYIGKIVSIIDNMITLDLDGVEKSLPFTDVVRARTHFVW